MTKNVPQILMENGNTVGRDTGDKYNLFLEARAGLLILFNFTSEKLNEILKSECLDCVINDSI